MSNSYKNQYLTTMNVNENVEGIVLDEIKRLLPIIKLKELYRYKSALVHYRYDFTPRVECTVAELAWGFVRDPCYANQVTERLIEILPDIRDEPPVFVTEWNNIITTVTTSLQGPSIVKSEAVMDTFEEVVEINQEDIDYSDVPGLETITPTFSRVFDIENQITEQILIGGDEEEAVDNRDDRETTSNVDLSNLYSLFEEFRANRNKQDQEIDEARARLADSIKTLQETAERTENYRKANTITVKVFTEYDLKKNRGMDLATNVVLPASQVFSVPLNSTWAETVLFEVENSLNRIIPDNTGVYVFVDRINGTVRPLDLIGDYVQIKTYQLLNGEVWLFVSETPAPKTGEEICVHVKWLYKRFFWYQGTKILNRFQPIGQQLQGKPFLYEEITAVKGEEIEVNKIDIGKCPYEVALGNGDILVYSKNQEFSVDDVKESVENMIDHEKNMESSRERFLSELGNQI